jgi:hypothetical protein
MNLGGNTVCVRVSRAVRPSIYEPYFLRAGSIGKCYRGEPKDAVRKSDQSRPDAVPTMFRNQLRL